MIDPAMTIRAPQQERHWRVRELSGAWLDEDAAVDKVPQSRDQPLLRNSRLGREFKRGDSPNYRNKIHKVEIFDRMERCEIVKCLVNELVSCLFTNPASTAKIPGEET